MHGADDVRVGSKLLGYRGRVQHPSCVMKFIESQFGASERGFSEIVAEGGAAGKARKLARVAE